MVCKYYRESTSKNNVVNGLCKVCNNNLCTCGGSTAKCSYFSKNTIEKALKADKTTLPDKPMDTYAMLDCATTYQDKWYKTGDMYYNVSFGFVDDNGKAWPANAFKTLNEFMTMGGWEETLGLGGENKKVMTIAEAEKAYGIVIVK